VQPGPGGDLRLEQVGAEFFQRRGLHDDLDGLYWRDHAEPPSRPRQGGALGQREHSDDDEDEVEQARGARHAGAERDGGQHDRHRPAQPGPGQERLLPPAQPQRQRGGEHRGGPGEEHQHQPDDDGGQDLGGQPGRRGEQAEHDEQPDLGEPADSLREAAGGRAVRQPRVAEHHRGHVDSEEAARPGLRRSPVAGDDHGEHRDRVQARGGQRRPAQRQRAERSGREPDGDTPGQLPGHLGGEQARMGRVRAGLAEQRHREHGRRVVQP